MPSARAWAATVPSMLHPVYTHLLVGAENGHGGGLKVMYDLVGSCDEVGASVTGPEVRHHEVAVLVEKLHLVIRQAQVAGACAAVILQGTVASSRSTRENTPPLTLPTKRTSLCQRRLRSMQH